MSYGTAQDFAKAIEELRQSLSKDAVSTDEDGLNDHGHSIFDHYAGTSHSVVVYPSSTNDVVKIVKISAKYRMPVVPYSGGTSLEGNFRAPSVGGICVDMSRMNKILEIHAADSDLVCQAGAGWVDINAALKDQNIPLFFPLDPGPGATIGGMISTSCSGTNAVRYGTAKGEWFLNATIVLPSGEVIKTRKRSRKSSAGFDITKIFIGAEGTLGIITEATIRLAPLLPTTVAVVQFPDVRKATEAVIEILNQGIVLQCAELLDSLFMDALSKWEGAAKKWPVRDTVFFKIQGHSSKALQDTAELTEQIATKHGGSDFVLAKNEEEAEALWSDRKNAMMVGLAFVPGAKPWTTDVCVPISKLPDLIYATKEDLARTNIPAGIVGHIGDGNFHASLLIKTPEEFELAKGVVDRVNKRALELDGTCTGEHGVGIGKREYLVNELGPGTVTLMKQIKELIDPLGLFNPGKLYPDHIKSKL